jgi:DivIVA domain-containing protein
MYWFLAVLVVVVVGLAVLAYQGHLGGMPPMVDDRPGPDLPRHELSGADVRRVRFAVVTRGYSMAQVDAAMDRVADQMDGLPVTSVDDLTLWAGRDHPQEDQEASGPDVAGVSKTDDASSDVPVSRVPLGWPISVPARG